MNFLQAYGARVLSFATVALGLLVTQAHALGINEALAAWLTLVASCLTAAHTIFVTPEQQQHALLTLSKGRKTP